MSNNYPYVEMGDISGRIPLQFLLEALDDNQDGVVDAAAWKEIQKDVGVQIDGYLGQRYPVPFQSPRPAIVSAAARAFACELLYKRRGADDKVNPWHGEAETFRKKLEAIGKGEQPLTPDLQRQKPSVSVVAEGSKTSSRSGKIAN